MCPLPSLLGSSRSGVVAIVVLGAVGAVVAVALSGGGTFSPSVLLLVVAAFLVGSSAVRAARTRNRGAVLAGHARSRIDQFGGGFYGTVALATWVVLEGLDLHALWAASADLSDFVADLTLSRLFGFGVASVMNAVWAGLWPMHWMSEMGLPLAAAAAAVAGLIYWLSLRVSGVKLPASV